MALRYDYVSGTMYDDGEPDTSSSSSPEELILQMSPPARTFVDPFGDRGGANWLAGDEFHKGMGGGENIPSEGVELYPGWTGTGVPTGLDKFGSFLKNMGGKALDFAQTPQGIMALLAALAGAMDRQRASGGGTKMGMMAPRQYTRSVDPKGIVRYAAEGGLMHAYAHGGEAQAYAGGKPLVMEDGGFVFTEEATRKLRPQGIAALGGKMISAPGNGTNDKGITGIIGKHGVTPARVSDGESYFPKEAVEANGGPKRMYAAMNKLQGKA